MATSMVRKFFSELFTPAVRTFTYVPLLGTQSKTTNISSMLGQQQVRSHYTNWRMRRDAIRRQLVKEHGPERVRMVALKRNTILPPEIKYMASREIENLPKDSCFSRVRGRCAVTSRPRAVLKRWRLSRIQWRLLADYNKLSGVHRAWW